MNTDVQSTLSNGTFCNLQVSIWTASRKVATGSVDLGDTDETLFRINKDLVERSTLKPIRQAGQKAGEILLSKALPFDIRGVYYVPNSLIQTVTGKISAYETEFWRKVDEFCRRYPEYRAQARSRLNGHYREDDYPTEDRIRDKFAWRLKLMAFSAPDALQAVSPEMFAEATKRFQQDIQEFRDNSVALLREKFSELVGHVAERLTPEPDGTRKIFRNSMVGNLRDFLADFEALNITSDHELAAEVVKVRGLIEGLSPDDLRISASMATLVSQSMGKVQAAVLGMIEAAPKRRIRYQNPSEEAAA